MNDMNLQQALEKIKQASRKFALVEEKVVNDVLLRLAELLVESAGEIIKANSLDLAKMDCKDPLYDRVLLDEKRILEIAKSVREIAIYDSPIDLVLEERVLENGLKLKKVSVPLGVVGAIFEARPNVVIDTFALCFKSKNCCVMKGGSQAKNSNGVLVGLILQAIEEKRGENYFLIDAVLLLANSHELVGEFLKMSKYVDVIIPRGGQGLIDYVRENSHIPVIETGRGVCHTFVDESADLEMAKKIIFNAKTQRPSVCNSLDTLLVHRNRLDDLVEICKRLAEKEVMIFADQETFDLLEGEYLFLAKATEENFGMEYMSLKMSVKAVENLDEAIDHINKYGSSHSEAIITEDKSNGRKFLKAVDAAAVYINASTRFTDGGVFGLGAEVGISTQKLHARGPMGIKELTSYKWEIVGEGQIR